MLLWWLTTLNSTSVAPTLLNFYSLAKQGQVQLKPVRSIDHLTDFLASLTTTKLLELLSGVALSLNLGSLLLVTKKMKNCSSKSDKCRLQEGALSTMLVLRLPQWATDSREEATKMRLTTPTVVSSSVTSKTFTS